MIVVQDVVLLVQEIHLVELIPPVEVVVTKAAFVFSVSYTGRGLTQLVTYLHGQKDVD